jgi:hypothetical protein
MDTNEPLSMFDRSRLLISERVFASASRVVPCLGEFSCDPPDDQYILRMPIQTPGTPLAVPGELNWLFPAIRQCIDFQSRVFGLHPYIYATSRCGEVRSTTDDEWHVNGFSVQIPHVPEQNYFWCDARPTQVLDQTFDLPTDFSGLRHNISHYFQDHADENRTRDLEVNRIYAIDPYIVHRRPVVPVGTRRSFFRLTFVPIPIRVDADSTPNPLLPMQRFGLPDVRKSLERYGTGKA